MTHKQQQVPFHLQILANAAEQELLKERAELVAMVGVLKERIQQLETALHISQKNVTQAHSLVMTLVKKSTDEQQSFVNTAESWALTLQNIQEETRRTDSLLKILCERFFSSVPS